MVSRSLQNENRVKLAPICLCSLKSQNEFFSDTFNDNQTANLRAVETASFKQVRDQKPQQNNQLTYSDAGMATMPIICAINQETCQSFGLFFTYINVNGVSIEPTSLLQTTHEVWYHEVIRYLDALIVEQDEVCAFGHRVWKAQVIQGLANGSASSFILFDLLGEEVVRLRLLEADRCCLLKRRIYGYKYSMSH